MIIPNQSKILPLAWYPISDHISAPLELKYILIAIKKCKYFPRFRNWLSKNSLIFFVFFQCHICMWDMYKKIIIIKNSIWRSKTKINAEKVNGSTEVIRWYHRDDCKTSVIVSSLPKPLRVRINLQKTLSLIS